jgi:teichuronic acid exporter
MDVRSLVISGLRWSAGAKLGGQLVSWASTIVVMRLLNPNDYGLMAMAWVFIFFCRLLNELGLGSAVVQAKELSEHQLRQVFGLVILFNVILTGLLIAASPAIAWFFDEQRLVNMVIVLALQLPVMALAVVPEAVLVREMNFRAPAVVSVASDVTAAVIALALAFLGFGVWTLVLSNLAGVFTRTIGFNIASPYLKRPSFRFTEFAAMAKFGGYVTANRILWYVYSKSDTFIVGKMMGKTLLGYYSVALELASLPLAKVGSIVNQVALPAYSRIQDDRTKVRN